MNWKYVVVQYGILLLQVSSDFGLIDLFLVDRIFQHAQPLMYSEQDVMARHALMKRKLTLMSVTRKQAFHLVQRPGMHESSGVSDSTDPFLKRDIIFFHDSYLL